MSEITIFLDNSLNNITNNFPGFNQVIKADDQIGIKVDKTDTNLPFKFNNVSFLQTWYYEYEYGWSSGPNINGPFVDGQTISLIKIKY